MASMIGDALKSKQRGLINYAEDKDESSDYNVLDF